ncbi:hypothetical protein [uncultured Bradyrhizobium sp.]|uniref:hypothetical protein n=1 Tax=uncultured Bradyrhizobium sp. TaxID=199684 RepID=UPI0035CAAC18
MSLQELCNDFDREMYNGLLSIEAANQTVRTEDRLDGFLSAAAKLFVRHNVHERFGVGLLHKHNTCEPGERMVQYDCTMDDERALVTMPVRDAADPTKEIPNVWAVSDRSYVPLEYTTDVTARDSFHAGEVPAAFLSDFADLVGTAPAGGLFGLAVVKRALAQSAQDSEILLEYSDPVQRKNIVLLRHSDAAPKSITTAWTFEARSNEVTGETECISTQRCNCIVDDPGVPGMPPKHSHMPAPHHHQRPA